MCCSWFGLKLNFTLCCRDAVSDLAIHFLDKVKVMVVKDIEREDIEFITKVRYLVYTVCEYIVLTLW
jgi:chaperonin GroEL (HSP60 family)